jgi:hypothetical protein
MITSVVSASRGTTQRTLRTASLYLFRTHQDRTSEADAGKIYQEERGSGWVRDDKGKERGDGKIGNQCHMGKAVIHLHHLDNCGTVVCVCCVFVCDRQRRSI